MEQDIILYTTHCPKCKVLEKKLNEKNIPYTTITDIKEIEETGQKTVPLLSVNGNLKDFSEAITWVREYEN